MKQAWTNEVPDLRWRRRSLSVNRNQCGSLWPPRGGWLWRWGSLLLFLVQTGCIQGNQHINHRTNWLQAALDDVIGWTEGRLVPPLERQSEKQTNKTKQKNEGWKKECVKMGRREQGNEKRWKGKRQKWKPGSKEEIEIRIKGDEEREKDKTWRWNKDKRRKQQDG